MGKFIDLTGQVFGELTVIKRGSDYVTPKGHHSVQWLCKCSCGRESLVRSAKLINGYTKSCGCKKMEQVVEIGKANRRFNQYEFCAGYVLGHTRMGIPFVFDYDDFDLISSHCWSANAQGYVVTTIDGKLITMHQLVMGPGNDTLIDHINHDKTDNRKCNLRPISGNENQWNSKKASNNTSGVTGVSWDSSRQRWLASLFCNGKTHHLGRFDSFDDAVAARKAAEERYFGQYSYDNSMAAVPRVAV